MSDRGDALAARAAATPARAGWRWIVALVAVAAATLPWSVQAHWDAKPDAATYLIAARSLARGEGYRVMGEAFALRPPGWSLALAPLVAWRGIDFAALNALGAVFGIAAAALFLALLAPRTGAPVAFAAALALWLNPWFQQLCNQVLSDVPGLAAALLALVAMRWAGRRASVGRDVALAAALAAAMWLRTANALLVPALLLDRALAGGAPAGDPAVPRVARRTGAGLRHALLAAALAAATYVPWALQPTTAATYEQESLRSYASALVQSDALDEGAGLVGPAEIAGRLRANASAYVGLLGFSAADAGPTALAWTAAALGAAAWLAVLALRREAPEWFAGLTAATIAVYYVAQARLALAVAVLWLGAVVECARRLLLRLAPPRAADVVVVLCLAVAATAAFRADFMRPRSAERDADLRAIAGYLAETARPGERLGGDYGTVYALLLDRPVYGLQSLCNRRGDAAAREAIGGWALDRLVLQSDGPCAGLAGLGREEARRGSFIVLRLGAAG